MKIKNLINKIFVSSKFSSFGGVRGGLLLILALALFSCKDDAILEPDPIPGTGSSDSFVISFNFDLPDNASTRSSTGSGGTSDGGNEFGTINENYISAEVYFVIGEEDIFPIENFESDGNTLTAEIDPRVLIPFLGKDGKGENEIKIYITSGISGLESPNGQVFSYSITDFKIADISTDDESDGDVSDGDTDGDSDGYTDGRNHNYNGNNLPIANRNYFRISFEGTTELSGDVSVNDIFNELKELNKKFPGAFEDRTPKKILHLSKLAVDGEGRIIDNTNDQSVPLERLVARVDYKPVKAKDIDSNTDLEVENLYPIGVVPNLYALMTSMQVFNVSKSAYVFRHSAEGFADKAGEDVNLFGLENSNANFGPIPDDATQDDSYYTSYTWMADDDWSKKKSFYEDEVKVATTDNPWKGPTTDQNKTKYNYFHNQLVLESGNPVYTIKDAVAKSSISITDLKTRTPSDTKGYYPWCYLTENTLPSTETMIRGLSTGVAFSMILADKDGNPLKIYDEDAPIDKKDFITREEYDTAIALFEEAYEKWKNHDQWMLDNPEKNEQDYDKAEPVDPTIGKIIIETTPERYNDTSDYYIFKIGNQECYFKKVDLTPSSNDEDGDDEPESIAEEETPTYAYEVIYYYFFRHNIGEDYKLGYTGPMQFGVVRNNIYKLSVTALNDLPMPYDPSDPDEPQNAYMSVELKVLAWAKRDISVSW